MDNQANSNNNLLANLLEQIRRINMMLWAFDYVAAHLELKEIDKLWKEALDNAKKQEDLFRSEKSNIEENEGGKIRDNLRRSKLAGERLQVQSQREIMDKTLANLKTTEFDPTAMSLSGLASIITGFRKRVEQAKRLDPKNFEKLLRNRMEENESHNDHFIHAIEKRGDTHTIFRAYRLSTESVLTLNELQDSLNREFTGSEWRILSIMPLLPYKLRVFLNNAMATLVVYDQEHYRLEITHDNDKQISTNIAEQILKVVNS